MSAKFSRIDELSRGDHALLETDDLCWHLLEYTKPLPDQKPWEVGTTNDLILNLKMKVDKRGTSAWYYKEQAIAKAAKLFRGAFSGGNIKRAVLVPIPPSGARTDPLYDDRMVQVLTAAFGEIEGADVRDIFCQHRSMQPSRTAEMRHTVEDLARNYYLDRDLLPPRSPELRHVVCVVDDVLVAGAHFKAAKKVLLAHDPGLHVVGLFLARRVFPAKK